jgi:hypothetical protein
MASLPYEEQIYAHHATKPYSIDPFNELGISEKERDALLIKDFLESYEALSKSFSEEVDHRYFTLGRSFSD